MADAGHKTLKAEQLFRAREQIVEEMGHGCTHCCETSPFDYDMLLSLIGERTRLESRIRQQRHTITVLQAKARERNVSVKRWHQGREALLQEQLRQATSALYGWKAQAERLRAELEAAGE